MRGRGVIWKPGEWFESLVRYLRALGMIWEARESFDSLGIDLTARIAMRTNWLIIFWNWTNWWTNSPTDLWTNWTICWTNLTHLSIWSTCDEKLTSYLSANPLAQLVTKTHVSLPICISADPLSADRLCRRCNRRVQSSIYIYIIYIYIYVHITESVCRP